MPASRLACSTTLESATMMTMLPNFSTKSESSHRTRSVVRRSSTPTKTSLLTRPLSKDGKAGVKSLNAESEDPDLRSLNDALVALATVFPDIQTDVFREMLSSFDEDSRLQVAAEALLKHKAKWVRGRWRVPGEVDGDRESRTAAAVIPVEGLFRSEGYKKAVKLALYQEFKGLSRSSINAVLAEQNHSYTLARPTLLALSSKSWRFALSNFFLRRKPSGLGDSKHPLLIWQEMNGDGARVPTVQDTGNVELNKEILDTVVNPLLYQMKEQQLADDKDLAVQINNTEAEECEALHECECCFTATTFEQLSACDDGGHFICFRCLRHAVNEVLFGQGWAKNLHHQRGTLRCIAPMVKQECQGCIPQDLVKRALLEESGGEDLWQKLEDRIASDGVIKSNLPLIRCPFCSYAEVDDIYIPSAERTWRFNRTAFVSFPSIAIFVLGTGMIPFLLPLIIFSTFLFFTVSSRLSLYNQIRSQVSCAYIRLQRKRLGLRFKCRNSSCLRASCRACSKEWRDIHICFESERLALRAAVERAMAEAVKRTCPRCNLSFVKASGCNKLTCVCGYQMCYVCRKEVREEGYRHFCEHFRPDPGMTCAICDKCDLYKVENEETVVKRAELDAEREWRAKEGLGTIGRALVPAQVKPSQSSRTPVWQGICDWIMEQVVE